MRALWIIAAFIGGLLCALPDGHAYPMGPWCAVQSLGFGTVTENCSMMTFEQCRMETIAGNRGFCKPNPYWPAYSRAAGEPRRYRKHRARHR